MSPAALAALNKGNLKNFVAAVTPGGIEAQEKAGQIEQTFADTLPKNGTEGDKRKAYEALGFVFGTDADDIFINATFPKGWRKKPTDHSMWSDLVDDKGRKRGGIFYKAAFYDRSAHVHLSPRFSISRYESTPVKDEYAVIVQDYGVTSKTFGTYKFEEREKQALLEAHANKWLADNYPNWRDVAAYWD